MSRAPRVRTHRILGYEYARCRAGEDDATVYVHQLVAIREGILSPSQAFSGGAWHVHHRNGIPWDNRPENLEAARPDHHDGRDHRVAADGRGDR